MNIISVLNQPINIKIFLLATNLLRPSFAFICAAIDSIFSSDAYVHPKSLYFSDSRRGMTWKIIYGQDGLRHFA